MLSGLSKWPGSIGCIVTELGVNTALGKEAHVPGSIYWRLPYVVPYCSKPFLREVEKNTLTRSKSACHVPEVTSVYSS